MRPGRSCRRTVVSSISEPERWQSAVPHRARPTRRIVGRPDRRAPAGVVAGVDRRSSRPADAHAATDPRQCRDPRQRGSRDRRCVSSPTRSASRSTTATSSGIQAAGLMVRQGSRWQFRSDVVREVAYQTLTKQARAQRHAGVARYLAAFEPGLVDRRAHHTATAAELRAELGGDPRRPRRHRRRKRSGSSPSRPGDGPTRVRIVAVSGWSSVRSRSARRIPRCIDRCCSCGSRPSSTRTTCDRRGRVPVELAEFAEFADSTDDRVLRGEAERLLGTIEQTDGDLVAARVYLTASVDEFREIGDERRLAEALRARGFAEIFGGSLADADRFLSRGRGVVRPDRRPAWNGMGVPAPRLGVVPVGRPRPIRAAGCGTRSTRSPSWRTVPARPGRSGCSGTCTTSPVATTRR